MKRRVFAVPFILFAASFAAGQERSTMPRWLQSGLDAGIEEGGSERSARAAVWFETKPDLEPYELSGLIYDWRSEPADVDFQRLRAIEISAATRQRLGSSAEDTETYYLGRPERAAPPPPDWKRSTASNPSWRRAVAVDPGATAPFINGAQSVWAAPRDGAEATGEYLFRRRITIPEGQRVVQARLVIGGRCYLREAALNERPIHLLGERQLGLVEYEVTHLVREGENLVAFWAWSEAAKPGTQASLAFALEILSVPGDGRAQNTDALPSTLFLAQNGDRLWGNYQTLDPGGFAVASPFGPYEAAWSETRGLLFPRTLAAAVNAPAEASRFSRVLDRFGAGGRRPRKLTGEGLPTESLSNPLAGLALLTQGRVVKAAPTKIDAERVSFTVEGAAEYGAPNEEVLAIFPPAHAERLIQRPRAELAELVCRARTVHGDVVTGLLRQAKGRTVVIEAASGDFLRFHPRDLIRISFPHHLARPSSDPAQVRRAGLLGQAAGLEQSARAFESLSAETQEAAFIGGVEIAMISQDALADPGRLTPAAYPVLIIADPFGEYVDTLKSPADAREALNRYVRAGGTLLLYSRGGALRTAVSNENGRFLRTTGDDALLRALSLAVIHPNEGCGESVDPFDRPPNLPLELEARLAPSAPEGLATFVARSLPAAIPIADALSAPFYPMVSTEKPSTQAVYFLRDSRGRNYGPLLSVTPVERGQVIVVDHLLWHSQVDDQPFAREVLPALLAWAAASRKS